ncbi:MAG: hypothetical protein A3J66_02285 [Candidatus Magasanikbacteria bacterium RIFCSPHIGHO2_02_FULL_47_14]|uniref:histidine kinase n=1 Tax=Candidatus Magasanikbacteria bacterium RIFCSPHIGHO2_02_FULL_47_14 TaxID=1798680 RepID=A0A1F6M1F2_9BACT|nr:MAG: hypothetical protein A3J66_02285 [Candidatus Magasanikbacteria bacterium RIFCSPHIGHO2_02_FULL_47_14]
MEFHISAPLAILIITVIANALLAYVVYSQAPESATNRFFFLLSLTTTIWFVLMYASVQPGMLKVSLSLIRGTIFVAAPMSLLFFFLSYSIPNPTFTLSSRYKLLSILATVFVMIVGASPFAFIGVQAINGRPNPIPGLGLLPFVLLSTVFSVAAVVVLIRKLRRSQGRERQQLALIMSGMALMVGFIIGTILIPVVFFENNTFVAFAPLYILLFLSATALAIMKYQLFNVKIIATESLVMVLVFILLFEGLLAGSVRQIFYKGVFAALVGFLGAGVVRSVNREVQQKEELAQLAERLKKANDRLKELDELKTEFLSIASHQLRTPLSIIKGYSELLRDGAYGKMNTKEKKVLSNIDVSNERLIKLVDEFLNVSRIEQGRTNYRFADMNVVALVKDIMAELEEKAHPKGISLVYASKSKKFGLQIVGDEDKLRHAIYNFVDNAIKYSPEQTKVHIIVEPEAHGIAIRVRDSGVGMDQKDLANLFQKFYRSPHVMRDFQGTGLGLFVVRQFIEAHGGHVWADSKGVGKGSEFGFWIPLKAVPQPQPTQTVAQKK